MPSKPVTKEKALQRLASLCSRGEQCEFLLQRKLITWGVASGERKEILEYLKENRYLDDARYARSFANDKARFSSWGPYKIRAELSLRKIKPAFIKEAVAAVDSQVWKEALLKCASSKSKNLELSGEDGYENRQKLLRYLISRGFPSAASSKAVALMKKRQENQE